MRPGELVCPFIVISKGEDRQSIEFKANTQDEAVSRGWASLDEYRTRVDLWAFAREGLINGPSGKEDVLSIAVWKPGMEEPAIFLQAFLPTGRGGFALLGPVVAQNQSPADLSRIADLFDDGVRAHPKGHLWKPWHKARQPRR